MMACTDRIKPVRAVEFTVYNLARYDNEAASVDKTWTARSRMGSPLATPCSRGGVGGETIEHAALAVPKFTVRPSHILDILIGVSPENHRRKRSLGDRT